jgi:phosphatidate cytidylyltransferase
MAGYFAGRLIGGPKLAPQISPHKTWAGVIASFAAGTGAGAGCAAAWGGPIGVWAFVGFALAVLGLAGDLFESALKRRFGVKDASRIIPGHGGMLDRLDGLIAATLGAAIAVASLPWLLPRLAGE